MHSYESSTVQIIEHGLTSTKHIIGHIGDGFLRVNDPNKIVKALKEDRVLTIRLQSHQVHPACYNNMTYMQYEVNTKYKHINTNKSTHSEMGPV